MTKAELQALIASKLDEITILMESAESDSDSDYLEGLADAYGIMAHAVADLEEVA